MFEEIKRVFGFGQSRHEHEFVYKEVLSVEEFTDQGATYEKHRELLVCKCGQKTIMDVLIRK